MAELHLLLVEDDPGDQSVCEDTVKVYRQKNNRDIRLTKVTTKANAHKAINNEIDAAIIDLKLGNDSQAGVTLIEEIRNKWRIPVAVFTATPMDIDDQSGLISVYKKGETGYDEVIDQILEIYDTGVTRIFGGRGVIEQEMDRVFWHAVLPSVQAWVKHQKAGKSTEKALLRFAVNHLMEFLHDDTEAYFAEEAYVIPPPAKKGTSISQQLRTGSIVRRSDQPQGEGYAVITPSCDLVVHGSGIKTERILLCSIEGFDHYAVQRAQKLCRTKCVDADPDKVKQAEQKSEEGINTLRRICSNNYCPYLHYLPPIEAYTGGLINFRRLEAFAPSDFDKVFSLPFVQISPMFTKDIVSRFSTYYARQGQPDLDFTKLAADLAKGN